MNKSQYCFVNECVIKISESNILLSVVNVSKAYEDQVLIDGNSFQFFLIESSVCLKIMMNIIVVLSAINIILHLLIKELRNVIGVLIVWFCIATAVISLLRAIYTYLHQVNEDTGICAAPYLSMYMNYHGFHFAYLMYRSHRVN